MSGFQSSVSSMPAPGVAGDRASLNPLYTYDAGPGGLVAGSSGVTVGRFGWVSSQAMDFNASPAIVNNFGSGVVSGIVARLMQGVITTFLADASLVIPQGYPIGLVTGGDFWVKNDGATAAVIGQKAYAGFTDGKVTFAASGAPTTASATASVISAGTAATFTGAISGNVMTAAATVTNTIYPGAVISGAGVATGTMVFAQLTGTTGKDGTYALSIGEQTIASEALTATPQILDTTGGSVTGTIVLGSTVVSAAGSVTGTVVGMGVTALNTPTAGKHVLGLAPGLTVLGAATSGTIVMASNVETSWIARSNGLAGEVIKIANIPAALG